MEQCAGHLSSQVAIGTAFFFWATTSEGRREEVGDGFKDRWMDGVREGTICWPNNCKVAMRTTSLLGKPIVKYSCIFARGGIQKCKKNEFSKKSLKCGDYRHFNE